MSWKLRLGLAAVVFVSALLAGWLWSRRHHQLEFGWTGPAARLRQILSGQSTFHKGDYDGDNAYNYTADFSDLYYMLQNGQPIKLIDKALADADVDGSPGGPASAQPQPSPPRPDSGFFFADIPFDASGRPYDYSCECAICAWPAQYGKTGQYTYVTDITGSIYWKDLGPASGPLGRFPDLSTWTLVQ